MTQEERIRSLGKRIHKIYAQANKELTEKVDSFFADFERLDKIQKAKLSDEEYRKWRKNKLLMGEKYKQLRDNVGQTMLEANKTATAIINREIIPSYATGYNFEGKKAEDALTGYSFDLIDEDAVKRLTTSNKTILPYKVVNGKRDVRWNTKHVNSAILQGIIQGESIPKISKRLEAIAGMNEDSARRNARTAVTGAHNSGRQDCMHKLNKDGVIVQKEWLATTGDSRTRDAHLELHHVVVDEDKPFENSIGRIMFPGDPNAHPANVYNCRCSIVTVIKGFRKEMGPEPEDSHIIAEGQDITGIWERRPDKFDFEIEDVINAQGFDGVPKVVSPEEFDRIAKDTEAICKRGYNVSYETSGNDAQAVLDRYHEELIEGKWYVDCHVGGADYGQGMYSYVKHGDVAITSKMDEAVEFYAGDNGRTEVFTFGKDMKIVKSSEIKELKKMDELSIQKRADKAFGVLDAEEKDIAERMAGIKPTWGKEGSKAIERFGELSEERQEAIQNAAANYGRIVREETEHYKKMDDGVYAALKGYDAIEADYDLGDNTHELVILNRTKLIFRGR